GPASGPFRASPPGSRWGSTSGSGGRSCLTCQPLTALLGLGHAGGSRLVVALDPAARFLRLVGHHPALMGERPGLHRPTPSALLHRVLADKAGPVELGQAGRNLVTFPQQ